MFDEFFSGFRAKFQKRVTSVDFQPNLRKRIRKLPKFLKFVRSIQFYSILFNRVLTLESRGEFRRRQRHAVAAATSSTPTTERGAMWVLGDGHVCVDGYRDTQVTPWAFSLLAPHPRAIQACGVEISSESSSS